MKPYTFVIGTDQPTQAILIAKKTIEDKKVGGYLGPDKFYAKGYSGTYRKVAGGVEITITAKPTFLGVGLPNEKIEKKIREYFASASA